jgi:hypothetical protein
MNTKAMNNYNEGMKEETCKESKKEITEGCGPIIKQPLIKLTKEKRNCIF